MIDHTNCDHESTSGARARCRRARARDGGEVITRKKKGATPVDVWVGKAHHNPDRERNRGTTPRDKDKQCHTCGIERILYRGTDPLTGIVLYVGERCMWRIENEDDFEAVP